MGGSIDDDVYRFCWAVFFGANLKYPQFVFYNKTKGVSKVGAEDSPQVERR